MELRAQALLALQLSDPDDKVEAVLRYGSLSPDVRVDVQATLCAPVAVPGRPARPALIDPALVPQRSPFTAESSTTPRTAEVRGCRLAGVECDSQRGRPQPNGPAWRGGPRWSP